MILSDRDIKKEIENGNIIIKPFDHRNIQPSSVDIRLDSKFLLFRNTHHAYIDPKKDMQGLTKMIDIKGKPLILHPGEFILANTLEHISMPKNLAGKLEGKSSLGRIGLIIHATAGFVDPGWRGNLTLELSNVAKLPIKLYPGMKIGQISFLRMSSDVEKPYGSPELGSKYRDSQEPVGSKYHEEFEKE